MFQERRRKRVRVFGALGSAGVAVFAAVCGAVQFLRADLNWLDAPLSNYLIGDYAQAVIAAYLSLGIALIAIGIGFYRGLLPTARSAAPLLLFIVAGLALCVTALSEPLKGYGYPVEWEMVHLAAAETTFLCVSVAMLLQSWWMRRDARWRSGADFALLWALATFAALWIYALWRSLPRGLSQKTVIVLILCWLGLASIKLMRKVSR